MRELIFQAWDKERQEMFQVIEMSFEKDRRLVLHNGVFRIYRSLKDVELREFIGVYDSTEWHELKAEEKLHWKARGKTPKEWIGQPIYEGDRVRYEWYDLGKRSCVGVIVFRKGAFVICHKGSFYSLTYKTIKIIGDVYRG